MKYVTPAVLRNLGTGLPLSDLTDTDVAGLIDEAESLVDAEMGFDEAQALGFAAGVRSESQLWNPATRRVNPTCFPVPVQSVQSFTIQYGINPSDGSPQVATIPPTEVVINNDYDYEEVITLAVILSSIAPILAFTGVIEPICRFSYTASYRIAKTSHRLYPSNELLGAVDPVDGESNAAVSVWHSRLPFWDAGSPVVVSINNLVLDPSQYLVNFDDGSVQLLTSYQFSDVVKASFVTTIPPQIVQICKRAFAEVAGEYFPNMDGMAGYDAQRNRDKAGTRRKIGSGERTWRDDLQAFKPIRLAMA